MHHLQKPNYNVNNKRKYHLSSKLLAAAETLEDDVTRRTIAQAADGSFKNTRPDWKQCDRHLFSPWMRMLYNNPRIASVQWMLLHNYALFYVNISYNFIHHNFLCLILFNDNELLFCYTNNTSDNSWTQLEYISWNLTIIFHNTYTSYVLCFCFAIQTLLFKTLIKIIQYGFHES